MDAMPQIVNGLVLGSIYALIAVGYALIFSVLGLINFSHSAIFMVGGLAGYYAIVEFGWGLPGALAVAIVVSGCIGYVVERVVFRPLRRAPNIATLVCTLGVAIVLENGARLFSGSATKSIYEFQSRPLVTFFNTSINTSEALILGLCFVLVVGIHLLLTRTTLGRGIRAVAEDRTAAALMGVRAEHVISLTFVIGSALGGLAGILTGLYYNAFSYSMGVVGGMRAFAAAIFGGLGSFPGAVIGGFIIGSAESWTAYFSSTLRSAIPFLIMILILLFRPTGLLGVPKQR